MALGIHARLMQALGLEQDLAALAADDLLRRKLQNAALPMKRRSPRKTAASALAASDDILTPTPSRAHEKGVA
jgi:hypothetical protein